MNTFQPEGGKERGRDDGEGGREQGRGREKEGREKGREGRRREEREGGRGRDGRREGEAWQCVETCPHLLEAGVDSMRPTM